VSSDRDLDVVVLGASGFVGRLVADYLADHAPDGMRIGLAGRSRERLADIRARLGGAAAAWPLLVADVTDPASLAELARSTRVVATTAGPYRPHGLALVEACATAATDYADLAGEVLFMRESIDRYHDVAAAAGTRIVHCCGVDSIPSDLGVLLLHDAARALVADPYALSPDRAAEPHLGDEHELEWITHDDDLGSWVGPFPMAGINTRVVRRSNALQGWAYGRRFRYREVTGFGAGPAGAVKGAAVTAALAGVMAGLGFGPSRALLDRVLPQPGQGPSEKTRRAGLFRIKIHTHTSAGVSYTATAAAHGDPGYQATSVMLGESALCLALDRDRLPDRAGVLTPATAMGAALAGRLRAAGHTLETHRTSP
jgi:short subunit dehydrogenase-like uncharacterized protein